MDERQRDFLAVIGYVYLQHGNAKHAASLLEAIRLAFPHDRDAICLLAYAYLELKRYADSLELTDFLLGGQRPDESPHIWLMRSRALFGLGRHEEARQLWKQTRPTAR